MNEVCDKRVSDNGWAWHKCGKKAKWLIKANGKSALRCGIHAKRFLPSQKEELKHQVDVPDDPVLDDLFAEITPWDCPQDKWSWWPV